MRELRYSDYVASYDELRYGSSYVSGSNVLQLEPLEKEEKKRKKKTGLHIVKPKKNVKRGKALYTRAQAVHNSLTLAVTVVALVIVCLSCMNYLQLQTRVSTMVDEVAKLENQYVSLKTENDLTEVVIDSTIDYNHILDVAVNELGMVYAEEGQVVVYNSNKMECVKQLDNIPKQ
ncbi:MAG: hypothetical protein ACI4AQ_04020 [Lachnospiraceae bacterium]